jgi:S-(hydroxymethyl)glutathione dehydrogenase/alcohol dehydrogenase
VKAAVCRSFGVPLAVEDLRIDRPGPGEVLVEIAACAICHSDIAFAQGAWGGELPAVYGHEAAGVVRDAGRDVTAVALGDRVVVSLLRSCGECFFCVRGEWHLCAGAFPGDRGPRLHDVSGEPVVQAMHTGAFAEEVVVHESQVAVLPDSVAFDVAALLGCGVLTGVGAVLDKIGVPPGASVVVVGTGGVGLNVVQGAALASAETIVAIDVSASKRALALSFGATHAVDPSSADSLDAVRALTEGRGADHVFVTVGRGTVIESALGLARRGGTVAVLGMPPSDDRFSVVGVDLVHDDVRLIGGKIGSGSPRFADTIPRFVQLYEEGRLKLDELITGRYPLEEINEAIAAAESGDSVRNVIVLGRE